MDMLDQNATLKQEDILLLLQRVLILLGGASHTIIQERRRIAWGCVNLANTLPEDAKEGKEKQVTLFYGGFLLKKAAPGTGEGYWKQTKWRPSSEEVKVPRQGSQQPTSFFGEWRAHKIRQWEPYVSQVVLPAAKKVPNPEEREQETKQLTRGQLPLHTQIHLTIFFPYPLCISSFLRFPTASTAGNV